MTVSFGTGPEQGELLIIWNGEKQRINLSSKKRKGEDIKLLSKHRLLYANLPIGANHFRLISKDENINVEKVSVVLFNQEIYSSNKPHTIGNGIYQWEHKGYWFLTGHIISNLFKLVVKCLYIIFVFYIVGLPLSCWFLSKVSFYEKVVIPIITGAGIFISFQSSIIYLLNLTIKESIIYFLFS